MPTLQSDAEGARPGVLADAAEFSGLPPLAGKLLPLGQIDELYLRARQRQEGGLLENLLAEMEIELKVATADVNRIPATGATVVVANHPFGVLDGAVLDVVLSRVRPDVKIMTNFLLAGLPELESRCIFVDPFRTQKSADRNRRALRDAHTWLRQGCMLAVFPAGEVSHWRLPEAAIADPQWNDVAARLIRGTGATALPVYFCGRNSVGFQLLGLIHPRLRTAFLLQEFLQKRSKRVELRIGSAIPCESVAKLSNSREATDYLRWRTYLLAHRGRADGQLSATVQAVFAYKPKQAIDAAISQSALRSEIEALPRERSLVESGDLSVFATRADEAPSVIREIGRLREVTFRDVGEGTGKNTDLDNFDRHYWHLVLWNKTRQEIVGAYRAGNTEQIISGLGVRGLYTSTLFKYDKRLFQRMGPALELGRSFVRIEYQRQYTPLLLLWKGIARFVAANPETPLLFGAVSISNDYNRISRELIVRYFESKRTDNELARWIRPRKRFRPATLRTWDWQAMCKVLRDLNQLAEPISDMEIDGKGLPILLKQYAKVGGQLVGFNVDRHFSNVLDGLVVVDLRRTERSALERYMGREGLARFYRHHGVGEESRASHEEQESRFLAGPRRASAVTGHSE